MSSETEIAIIGAGPYGLSIAAHLRASGIPFRVFGLPMDSWAAHMPEGMCLKSDGFASNLYAPDGGFTLHSYCTAHGLPYEDLGLPVPLDTFVAYGLAFQQKLVPTLEPARVTAVHQGPDGFSLELANGERLRAQRVVVATGISQLEYTPPVLRHLPRELCSHSSAHHDLSDFRGREVVVIGAGASATDLAGLLHAHGASVRLLARHPVAFHSRGRKSPSLWRRLTRPNLGLGPSFLSAVVTVAPGLFRVAPSDLRLRVVRRHLGPAGGWFVKDSVVGKIAMYCGYTVHRAEAQGQRVVLRGEGQSGRTLQLESDHVIAATGYRVTLSRLGFLSASLLQQIVTEEEGSPRLSRHFESSVPGLYFVGLAAAATFGPLLRFALGARYTSQRLSAHLTRMHTCGRRHASVVRVPGEVTHPGDSGSRTL